LTDLLVLLEEADDPVSLAAIRAEIARIQELIDQTGSR
jgi:hypothetical protein